MLERLCELHDGLVVEAKGIKQHYFKPYIHKLFQKQVHSLTVRPLYCLCFSFVLTNFPHLDPERQRGAFHRNAGPSELH